MENDGAKMTIGTQKELKDIILGGAFLGSGGGGPMNLAEDIMEQILATGYEVPVIQLDQVDPLSHGTVIALMGSPEAASHGMDMSSALNAFNAMGKTLSGGLQHALPIEIGAVNSLVPIYVAAMNRISVIDGDGAARAVPKIQNTTFAQGTSISPSVLSNGKREGQPTIDNVILMSDVPQDQMADQLESYALDILASKSFGSLAGLATYLLEGKDMAAATIPGTLSYCCGVGSAISGALSGQSSPEKAVCDYLSMKGIYHRAYMGATVTRIVKPGGGTLDVGQVHLKNTDGEMILQYENENLFATLNGKPWGMAPDSLCYVGPKGSMSNVEIQEGMEVSIIGIAANPLMRCDGIVESFMKELARLGVYTGSYVKIEDLED